MTSQGQSERTIEDESVEIIVAQRCTKHYAKPLFRFKSIVFDHASEFHSILPTQQRKADFVICMQVARIPNNVQGEV
jgi:hypothetical protein